MKKEDSKEKAKVYGQNEKIWYLCIPYYFLSGPTMSLLETKMGDKGLLIYMRLLFLATASQGILKLDNAEQETFFGKYLDNGNAPRSPRSPISSIVDALGNRYSEQEIYKTLTILEQIGAIKVLAEEQVRFRDVYEMGVERQRRAAEKRAQQGRIMFENEGLEESEEPEEAPAQIEEQPEETEEETEEERKKREKKEAAKKKKREEEAAANEMFDAVWKMYPVYKDDVPDKVKKTRRIALYKIGKETVEQAIKLYINVVETQRAGGFDRNWKGCAAFFNTDIDAYIRRVQNGETAQEGQPVQPPKPVTEEDVIKKLIEAEVETPSGFDWDRWDRFKPCCSPKEVEIAEARGRKLTGKTA